MEGVELRARRQAMGLGVRAIAHEIGVKPNTVSDWEANKRPIPEPVADRIKSVYDKWAQAVLDNVETALAVAEEQNSARGQEAEAIVFYVYPSKADFENAGGRSRYGTGWAGHTALVSTVALLVEAEGHDVSIVTFKDEPIEPTNVHENERGEQEW